jgi:serine/threonine-protein kinase HipA
MSAPLLDVWVYDRLVGTLGEESDAFVFSYREDVPEDHLVSLTMPVRRQTYRWNRGVPPFFQMNLPEGYQKDLLQAKLGPHADVTDAGLLVLTGHHAIGRVRVLAHGQALQSSGHPLPLAELLASPGSRSHLLHYLEQGVADGISGVMPKTLRGQNKATIATENYILKTGRDDLPGLVINEFLCLEVARAAHLEVPDTKLSEDGEVLAVRRFDRPDTGPTLGVEDFCAIKGLSPASKYKGSLEDLAKLLSIYVSPDQLAGSARRLFKLLVLNYALRNADAHLKNYALTYTSTADVKLAPVYDVVTVTAYPDFMADIPGLTLAGKKIWPIGKLLHQYGATRLSLTTTEMAGCVAAVTDAIQKLLPEVSRYAQEYPSFREVAKRMLTAWDAGIWDVQPAARTTTVPLGTLRVGAGLSDAEPLKKKFNPYENPDGAFSHKSR